jgi:hypothetical protein
VDADLQGAGDPKRQGQRSSSRGIKMACILMPAMSNRNMQEANHQ